MTLNSQVKKVITFIKIVLGNLTTLVLSIFLLRCMNEECQLALVHVLSALGVTCPM